MTPPTLWDVIGGLLTFASIPEPPTFTTMYSTDARRWELMIDPSRSSRNPDQSAGTSGLPPISFGLPHMLRPPRSSFGARNAIGCGRCPIVQGLEAGGAFPVGLSFLCLLTICVLSQAPRLGGLHRTSRVPFRASFFTPRLHPRGATAQGLIACLYRRRGFPPITSLRFVAHSIHTPRRPSIRTILTASASFLL
jgi:hypothetical protein